jgi:hypothetical protein
VSGNCADIVYLVFNGQGDLVALPETTSLGRTDLDGIVEDIVLGKYHEPKRVVGFNLAEGWASDVSLYVSLACAHRSELGSEYRAGGNAASADSAAYGLSSALN